MPDLEFVTKAIESLEKEIRKLSSSEAEARTEALELVNELSKIVAVSRSPKVLADNFNLVVDSLVRVSSEIDKLGLTGRSLDKLREVFGEINAAVIQQQTEAQALRRVYAELAEEQSRLAGVGTTLQLGDRRISPEIRRRAEEEFAARRGVELPQGLDEESVRERGRVLEELYADIARRHAEVYLARFREALAGGATGLEEFQRTFGTTGPGPEFTQRVEVEERLKTVVGEIARIREEEKLALAELVEQQRLEAEEARRLKEERRESLEISRQETAEALKRVQRLTPQADVVIRTPERQQEQELANLRQGILETESAYDRIARQGQEIGKTSSEIVSEVTKWREEVIATQEAIDQIVQKTRQVNEEARRTSEIQQRGAGLGLSRRQAQEYETVQRNLSRLAQNTEAANNELLGGAQTLRTLERELASYGVGLEAVTKAQTDNSLGVTLWTARVQNAVGSLQNVTIATDRWGSALTNTSKRFRNFTSAIGRNIGEVVKWGVATTVVYGTLRELNETIRQSIEIQSELADVEIAIGRGLININEVFNNAVQISRDLGVEVSGVIDGYVLAYRAAGRYSSQTERAAKATALLRDSMILSRLSGLDQAQALDALVGALGQLGYEYDRGIELVNKWVAVSRNANVSLETLAESFAITSAAAERVGADVDELNGLIATIAEVTTLSASEAGNAVRAFISGIQTDQAQDELAKVGIAVRDVEGNLRDFVDIIREISALGELEVLSPQEIAKLSEVLGGGARRGAQFNTVFTQFPRIQQLAEVSANATTDAVDALDIQLDTVQTTLTNLSNSFIAFGRTLGEEGGVLDIINTVATGLTAIIDGMTQATQAMKSAVPAILAVGVALRALQTERVRHAITGLATGFANLSEGAIGRNIIPPDVISRSGELLGTTAGKAFSGAAIGVIVAGLSGELKDALEGDAGSTGKVIGTVISSTVGGLLGGPTGALIGATIATAFIREVELNASDVQRAFTLAFEGELGRPEADVLRTRGEAGEVSLPEAVRRLEDAFEDLDLFAGNLLAAIERSPAQREALGRAVGAEGEISEERAREILTALLASLIAGIDPETLGIELGAIEGDLAGDIRLEPLRNAIREARELAGTETAETVEVLFEIIKEKIEEGAEETAVTSATAIDRAIRQQLSRVQQPVGGFLQQERETRQLEFVRGEGTLKSLEELEEVLQGLDLTVAKVFATLGEESVRAALGVDTTTDAARRLAEVLVEGGEESRNKIIDLVQAIYDAETAIENIEPVDLLQTDVGDDLPNLRAELRRALGLLEESVSFAQLPEFPSVVEFGGNFEELNDAIELSKDIFIETMEAMGYSYEEALGAMQKATEDFVVEVNDELQKISAPTETFRQAVDELGITTQDQLRILTPDISLSQTGPLLPGSPQRQFFENLVSQIRPLEEIPTKLITNDNRIADLFRIDMLVLQLLMRDLIDVNEKQLEGVYNIPEGVTALIAATGQLFFSTSPINRGGGGGGTPLTAEEMERILREQQDIERTREPVARDIGGRGLGAERVAGAEPLERSIDSLSDNIRDFISSREDFRGPVRGGTFPLTGETADVPDAREILDKVSEVLPEEIPVYANFEVSNVINVFLDGQQIAQELNVLNTDAFKTAMRAGGLTTGYITPTGG